MWWMCKSLISPHIWHLYPSLSNISRFNLQLNPEEYGSKDTPPCHAGFFAPSFASLSRSLVSLPYFFPSVFVFPIIPSEILPLAFLAWGAEWFLFPNIARDSFFLCSIERGIRILSPFLMSSPRKFHSCPFISPYSVLYLPKSDIR